MTDFWAGVDWDDERIPIIRPYNIGTWELDEIGTADGIDRLGKKLCMMAAAEFQLTGQVTQSLLVYCQKDPMGKVSGRCVYRTGCKPGKENMYGRSKDAVAMLVSATAKFGNAACVAHICEMWLAEAKGPEEQKRVDKWREEHNGSLEGFPGVKDTVGIFVETKRGARSYSALIHTDPIEPDKRTLGLFADKGYIGVSVGRFMNFLSPLEKN